MMFTLAALGIGYIIVFLLGLIFAVTLYLLKAIALHKIANRQGLDFGWIAWIPLVNLILIPALVENDVHDSLKGKSVMIYVVTALATLIPIIGPVAGIVLYVLNLYFFYILVNKYSGSAPLHTILFGLLVFTGPFTLFFIRNNALRVI